MRLAICLLFASVALGQYIPPTGGGSSASCGSPDCAVSGNLSVGGTASIGATVPGLGTQITAATGTTGPLPPTASRLNLYNTSDVLASTFDNSKYNAFGTLVQARSGKLIYVYREGASHVGAGDYGIIRMLTSVDGWKTLVGPTTVSSEASVDLRNVAAGLSATGRVVITYSRLNPDTSVVLSLVSQYSDDEGATWSARSTLPLGRVTAPESYGRIMALQSGTLLQFWNGNDGTNYDSNVATSTDDGVTWGSPVRIITSTTVQYSETSCAYAGGSSLVCIIREDNVASQYRQVHSLDNGATWVDDGNTGFGSNPAAPPELNGYIDALGARMVALVYTHKATNQNYIRVGRAADLLASGTAGWNALVIGLTGTVGTPGEPTAVFSNGGQKVLVIANNQTSTSNCQIVSQSGTMPLSIGTDYQIASKLYSNNGGVWIGGTGGYSLGAGVTAAFNDFTANATYLCFGCNATTNSQTVTGANTLEMRAGTGQSNTAMTTWSQGNSHVGTAYMTNPGVDNTFHMGTHTNNDMVLVRQDTDKLTLAASLATFSTAVKATGWQSSDGTAGATLTVVVKGSDGNNCNVVYKNGLLVSTTCP